MRIRGLFDRSLSSKPCIRGFAKIKELARISKANYKYQRKLLSDQEETITNFLETEKYLFFPEVILSYNLKFDYTSKTLEQTPIQLLENGKMFRSNIDKAVLKVKRVDYKSIFDVSERNELKIVELFLDDTILQELIDTNNHPFHRIDGNHRLSAAEKLDTDRVINMNVPFCIILEEETYINKYNADKKIEEKVRQENPEKFEMVVFHNINTKSVPLTSEQNLRVIIDDEVNFPDDELREALGESGVKTRMLIKKVNPEFFTGIKHILSDHFRAYYLEVFDRLLEEGISEVGIIDKVFESLKEIDVLYSGNDELKANSSFGLLTAFLYYHVLENKAKFQFFKDWVIKNHIFGVHETSADSFIKIFDSIFSQIIKVFVAMPYYEGDPMIMESYNQAYGRVIQKVKDNHPHVKIELFPIMQHQGKTRDIVFNMINEIRSCNIFVADITGGNANVGYELGIARSLSKPTIIVRQMGDDKKVPFDYEHDVRKPFNEKAIHTLEATVYDDIVGILRTDYGYVIN